MESYEYQIFDVFTDTRLSGNPLAIVFDADALDAATMQKIAAEFNLSETVFLLKPQRQNHSARLRIFMPTGELPFAGHPTVGAIVALGLKSNNDLPQLFALEEQVGVVQGAYSPTGAGFGEFNLPKLPVREMPRLEKAQIAAALGLTEDEIGFENHIVTRFNAGNPFLLVPVRDLAAAGAVKFNEALWLSYYPELSPLEVVCPYVYCRETRHHEASIHARLFAPHHGIPEDPATGSAVASLAGSLALFDGLVDGATEYVIEQGVEMGRPSKIKLELDALNGELKSARIGGNAVKVAEGRLFL